jgi:hypothetical protein
MVKNGKNNLLSTIKMKKKNVNFVHKNGRDETRDEIEQIESTMAQEETESTMAQEETESLN